MRVVVAQGASFILAPFHLPVDNEEQFEPATLVLGCMLRKTATCAIFALCAISAAALFVKYVINQDFAYETKPIETFTEDDL